MLSTEGPARRPGPTGRPVPAGLARLNRSLKAGTDDPSGLETGDLEHQRTNCTNSWHCYTTSSQMSSWSRSCGPALTCHLSAALHSTPRSMNPTTAGGLLTLVHRRHKGAERPRVKRGRHHLCFSVRATPKLVLSIANVHPPPKHSLDQRYAVVQAVAAFAKAPPGIQTLWWGERQALTVDHQFRLYLEVCASVLP